MKKLPCPSCGAEVEFASNFSISAVCKYCSSLVVRHDMDVESIGKMAALPDDMSPFQIGTQGYCNNVPFTLVGRMKIGWQDGCWNEWFMVCDDMRKGWLAEAQGFYALCFEVDAPPAELFAEKALQVLRKEPDAALIGSFVMLNERKFRVVDIKQTSCLGSEGELPVVAPRGRKALSIDLLGTRDEFACVEIELKDASLIGCYSSLEHMPGYTPKNKGTPKLGQQRAFIGHYVEWPALRCSMVREFDGW